MLSRGSGTATAEVMGEGMEPSSAVGSGHGAARSLGSVAGSCPRSQEAMSTEQSGPELGAGAASGAAVGAAVGAAEAEGSEAVFTGQTTVGSLGKTEVPLLLV